MEKELQIRKKGQVIQHRHVSPPLPSSSQLAGIELLGFFWLNLDSPTRRVLEWKESGGQYQRDVVDIEIVSSPPLTSGRGLGEDVAIVSLEPSEGRTETPRLLGGSSFRRKQLDPRDISSPVTITAASNLHFDNSVFFDSISALTPGFQTRIPSIPSQPLPSTNLAASQRSIVARTSSGQLITISKKPPWKKVIKEKEQQHVEETRRQTYFGVDIHRLLYQIENQSPQASLL